jgi:16S rRNA pseudouridine516 synthase
MRLDRILANSGGGTRSQIKKLIRSGAVSVGDIVVVDPGTDVPDDRFSTICVSGNRLDFSDHIYLCLHKPDCCLTARKDQRLPTVEQFIPEKLRGKGISPVGRLDYHTTGVLLLTNDGEMSHRLTSPKWHQSKSYTVTYSGPPLGPEERLLFEKGFILNDKPGERILLAPVQLTLIDDAHCTLTLSEGKTHQVKRMMAAVGRSVIELHRHDFGGIRLGSGQKPGAIRELTRDEILCLKRSCKMTE